MHRDRYLKTWRLFFSAITLMLLPGCDPPTPGPTRPYGPDLYLRGDIFVGEMVNMPKEGAKGDSWEVMDDRNRFAYTQRTQYELEIFLTAGTYHFKIADRTWKAINFGSGPTATEVELSRPCELFFAEKADDVIFTVKEDGNYLFTLFASNRKKPILVVESR